MSVVSRIRQWGFRRFVQVALQRIAGVDKHEEAIASLNYFLNQYVDITKLPPAKDPDLRILQLADVEFLALFEKFCDKHQLRFWLDYGTLLGAVRHHGVIPWDDDTDVSMMREDFERLYTLREELSSVGISLTVKEGGWYGLGYRHEQTGLWIDVYPKDLYQTQPLSEDTAESINRCFEQYHKKYLKHNPIADFDALRKQRKTVFSRLPQGTHNVVIQSPDHIEVLNQFFDHETLFPLRRGVFEGREFWIPNDANRYLRAVYGEDYMSFPQSGLLHHDEGRGALSTWAKKYGVDMNTVMAELQNKMNLL